MEDKEKTVNKVEKILCNGNEIIKRNIPFSPPDISELEVNEVTETLRRRSLPNRQRKVNYQSAICRSKGHSPYQAKLQFARLRSFQ